MVDTETCLDEVNNERYTREQLRAMWIANPFFRDEFHLNTGIFLDGEREDRLNYEQLLCFAYLDNSITKRNLEAFQWFLSQHDVPLTKMTAFCYLKDLETYGASSLLAHIGDWPEAIDIFLAHPYCLINPSEFHTTIFIAGIGRPMLLQRLTNPDYMARATNEVKAVLYHHLCVLGYYEAWYYLYIFRQYYAELEETSWVGHWWTAEQCVYYVRHSHPDEEHRIFVHLLDEHYVYGDELNPEKEFSQEVWDAMVQRQTNFLRRVEELSITQRETFVKNMRYRLCKDVANILYGYLYETVKRPEVDFPSMDDVFLEETEIQEVLQEKCNAVLTRWEQSCPERR